MLVPGSIMVVIAWAAFNLTANWYWPHLGLAFVAR
jgi:hypothetical protein